MQSSNRNQLTAVVVLVFVALVLLATAFYLHFRKTQPDKALAQGQIPVSQPWTSVGTFRGKILVVMSGQAVLHTRLPALGPDGYSQIAESSYALPGVDVFCSLAKHGGRIEKVGVSKEFFFPSDTELFLGANDEIGKQHGPGFSDNTGYWSYQVFQK